MSTVRRVYFYTVCFITLGMFSAGAGILLSLCFDILIKGHTLGQVGEQSFAREQLSLGLALVLIGGVLWFLFWRVVQRYASESPIEIGSTIRKLFMNLILAAAALVGLFAAAELLQWLMAGAPRDQFLSGGLATLAVTSVIWYYHWRVEEKEGQPSPAARTLKRWYVYLLSAWGLVWLCAGLVQLINTTVLHLPVWGEMIVYGKLWNSSVHSSLGWILLGGAIWTFHWFRMARGDSDSTLRQVYLYLLAIFGGAIAGLVALTTSLFNVFRFALGSPSAAGDTYFQFLGWTVPTMLVAGAVWAYHQQVVQEEAAEVDARRLSARRVLFYLMSFIGLGTLVAGLIMLLGILLELLMNTVGGEPVAVVSGWWQDQLGMCLALSVVAIPIWLYYWNRVLQMTVAGGIAEHRARTRRIFLYVVLGTAVITLAADLVNIIYQLLNGVLQGTFGVDVLRQSKWSLQTLVVALPVLLYHWRILRQDQRLAAEDERLSAETASLAKKVTVLASEEAADLITRIEERLGSQVRVLRYLSQAPQDKLILSDEEIDRLVSDMRAVSATGILLVVARGEIMVFPYEED